MLARKDMQDAALNEYQESIATFERARTLAPEIPSFRTSLATAWYQLAQLKLASKQWSEAEDCVAEYVMLEPDDPEWLISAAQDYALCAAGTESEQTKSDWQQETIEMVRRAIAAGWNNFPELEQLESFSEIQKRSDYRQLREGR